MCSLLLLRACCSNSYRTTMNLWLWHGYKRETCHSRFIIGQCTVSHPWGKIGNCLIYYSPPRGVLVNWSIYHFPLQFTISPMDSDLLFSPSNLPFSPRFTKTPQIYYFPLLRWTGPWSNFEVPKPYIYVAMNVSQGLLGIEWSRYTVSPWDRFKKLGVANKNSEISPIGSAKKWGSAI